MITVRNFRAGDLRKISGFRENSVKTNFPDSPFDREMFENILFEYAKNFPELVRVAEHDGEVIGYIWFRMLNSTVGKFGRVEHIFVVEEYRSRGVGKKLMQVAEEYLRGHGMRKVKVTVTAKNGEAVSLYENIGYDVRRFVMEKDLKFPS